nr:group-specific protein [Metabacillus mangrovi]
MEDVLQKLNDQQEHLPQKTSMDVESFLNRSPSQESLNEVFHLLKKYDLASAEEQQERNHQLTAIVKAES